MVSFRFMKPFLSLLITHENHNLQLCTHKHKTNTVTLAAQTQGDFGCHAPDGEGAALLQPELTRSDSGLLVPAALRAVVLHVATGLLTLPRGPLHL